MRIVNKGIFLRRCTLFAVIFVTCLAPAQSAVDNGVLVKFQTSSTAISQDMATSYDLNLTRPVGGADVVLLRSRSMDTTTLLNSLSGLDDFDSGTVLINGSDITRMADDRKTENGRQYFTPKVVAANELRLREHGIRYELISFEGGHEIDAPTLLRLAGSRV